MSYNGKINNLTGNKKSDEWYTPRFLAEKCYNEIRRFYVNPKILCPFDTEQSEFVKVGKEYGYNLEFNIVGNMHYEYDLLLTNPPFSINSFEMCLETRKDFMLVIPETFIFSVGFYNLLEKYNFHYKLYSPKQRVYFIDQEGKQNRPNFHTVIIYVSEKLQENTIEHFYSETKQLTHQHEDKGE